MSLESKVRAYIESIIQESPTTKEEYRAVLAKRKRERLIKHKRRLSKYQRSAINLIRRVDYSNIKPRLVFCSVKDRPIWNYLRHTLSSGPFKGRPGRQLYYFIVDLNSKGVMGVADIGSDVETLTNRDKHIGWPDMHTKRNRLKYIGNLGSCVPVAPFGFLTGGKLISVLSISSTVADDWRTRYGDDLAAIGTTSLFGKSSQYNRLKEYKYLGDRVSSFASSFVDPYGVALMRKYVMGTSLGTDRMAGKGVLGPIDLMMATLELLKWKDAPLPKMKRGVYFAARGENALPFLRGEDEVFFEDRRSQEEIVEWWMGRWYDMRLPKVVDKINEFDYSVYEWNNQIDSITSSWRK